MADPQDPDRRPDLIVLLGDQVYADKTAREGRAVPASGGARPGTDGPADEVVSFDEYTKLYLESWRDPEVRWLLATVPSVMIFDDHEIIDDWNTSASWRARHGRSSRGGGERIASRPGLVLGLPAPGQPAPGRAGRRPAVPEDHRGRGRDRPAARLRALGGPGADVGGEHRPAVPVELRARSRPHPAGHAGQPLQPGADPGPPGDAAARRSGTGSSTRPTATTTTWSSARPCPGCCRRRSTTSRPGTSRWPTRAGPRRAALAERIRRARRPGALGGVPSLLRRTGGAVPPARRGRPRARPATASAPAARTRLRPRSACSPATCTTRTSPGPTSGPHVNTPVHQLTCSPIHNQVPGADAAADAVQLVPRWPPRACAGPGQDRPGWRGRC